MTNDLVHVVSGADLLSEIFTHSYRLLGALLGAQVDRHDAATDGMTGSVELRGDGDADPQRRAVGTACLELLAAHLLACEDPPAHLESCGDAARGIGVEVVERAADEELPGAAEHLGHGAVDAVDLALSRDVPVRDRSFVVEVAEEPLVLAQAPADLLALDLRARTSREDAQNRKTARIEHRSSIEDRQVAEHDAVAVQERHAAVALRVPGGEPVVLGESLLHAVRVVRHLPAQHPFAGGAGQRKLEVGEQLPVAPDRERTKHASVRVELGDERVGDAEGLGRTADE